MKKRLTSLWAAVCLVGLVITAVSAHNAQLVESSPTNGALLDEAPAHVLTRFDEEAVYPDSSLKVFNTAGNQVDNGDGSVDLKNPEHDSLIVTLPTPLPDDVYTVEWQITLLDGDTTEGAFTFTVGSPAQTANPAPAPNNSASGLTLIAAALGIVLVLVLGIFFANHRN